MRDCPLLQAVPLIRKLLGVVMGTIAMCKIICRVEYLVAQVTLHGACKSSIKQSSLGRFTTASIRWYYRILGRKEQCEPCPEY